MNIFNTFRSYAGRAYSSIVNTITTYYNQQPIHRLPPVQKTSETFRGLPIAANKIALPAVIPVAQGQPLEDLEPIGDIAKETILFKNGAKIDRYTLATDFILGDVAEILDMAGQMLDDEGVKIEGFRHHFKLTYRYNGIDYIESTVFVQSVEESLEKLTSLIETLLAKYADVQIKSLMIENLIVEGVNLLLQGSKFSGEDVGLPETGTASRYNEDYIIYNPSSLRNCMFHAVVVCLKPSLIYRKDLVTLGGGQKTDPIVKDASNLKIRSGCENKVSTLEDIYRVAEYSKIKITIFDRKLEQIDVIDRGSAKDISLIVDGNHTYALIYFRDEEVTLKKKSEQQMVRKTVGEKNRDVNFYAADLESFTDENGLSIAYAIAYAYYRNTPKKDLVYREFIGHKDCVKRFFDDLFRDGEKKTVYFHNGGKYDINVIIQNYLLDAPEYTIDNNKKVYLNGRYAKFVVYKGKTEIIFLDSICLFNLSLEVTTSKKGFDVEHKKMTGAVNHNLVNIDNYDDVMLAGQGHSEFTGSQYLRNDVLGLLEAIDKFGAEIWEDYQINITKVISASSIAKRIFKQNFIRKEWPVYILSKEVDLFIRESYHGGRTEAFYKGVYSENPLQIEGVNTRTGRVYYYDFTSLYPSVASVGDCDLPYGKPHPLNTTKTGVFVRDEVISEKGLKFLKDNAVFLKCLVRTLDKTRIPLHCLQVDKTGLLVFPIFNDWTEIYLTGVEIIIGIEEGFYEYKPLEGCFFKKAPVLKEFFKSLTDKKAQATAQGLEGKALCNKIIANSGYGFWALKTEQRPDVDIINSEDLDSFLHRALNGFTDVYEAGSKIVMSFKKDITGCEKNIAIGSYITALARIKIWRLMDCIKTKGYNVLYCDTDSVLTTCRVEDHKDLMDEFMWDGSGVALGALKNEIRDAVKKDCKKNGLEVDSTDYIAKAVFAGLKSYRYEVVHSGGVSLSDSKLKGYKQKGEFVQPEDNIRKLDTDDYLTILKGGTIQQRVSQFSSNKTGKYQQWQKISKITKQFKFNYNKGRVNGDGSITPFTLPEDGPLCIDDTGADDLFD